MRSRARIDVAVRDPTAEDSVRRGRRVAARVGADDPRGPRHGERRRRSATLGTKADPAKDAIKVDGRRIKTDVTHRYIVLYKPKGYVTTRSDPEGRRTVMDLIGEGAYIYPVGRLDYDSEGLLLMMTDGDLAARLTHPATKWTRSTK